MSGTLFGFLTTLQSFVGTIESPDGSNLTPIGASFGWNGVAWCCETVSEALRQSGSPFLHEASVLMAREKAKAGANGMRWIPHDGQAQPGDAILFDWSGQRGAGSPDGFHIGTVLEVAPQSTFHTIEGNYKNRCDWVWRDLTYVQGFIRFPFDALPPAPPLEEEDMFFWSTDPQSGCHVRSDKDGNVITYNPDGSLGGHYLGTLQTLTKVLKATILGDVVGIRHWDDGLGKGFQGYVFLTEEIGKPSLDRFHRYNCYSDGRYR